MCRLGAGRGGGEGSASSSLYPPLVFSRLTCPLPAIRQAAIAALDWLCELRGLQVLGFGKCNLTDVFAEVVARYLRARLTQITDLLLWANVGITERGGAALLEAVGGGKNVDPLAPTNDTLMRLDLDYTRVGRTLQLRIKHFVQDSRERRFKSARNRAILKAESEDPNSFLCVVPAGPQLMNRDVLWLIAQRL